MFESLSEKFERIFRKLRGRGILTESDLKAALREVKLALLEADVHYKVAKEFIKGIEGRALGKEVLRSLTPAQQVMKIVHEEMTRILGGDTPANLDLSGPRPAALMLVGLHGSGKTTTAAKLALHLRRRGQRPYLVPVDPYRPAAAEQLRRLAASIGVDCYIPQDGEASREIVENSRDFAIRGGFDAIIFDTAGRLHIDEGLMRELLQIKEVLRPREVLLVADAMTGQDAVNLARGFNDSLGITGVILTKMEGDARAGAALSILQVTGRPIKFIGTGERLEALEVFHPSRIASRILGMGDLMTLIEKAEAASREEEIKAPRYEDFTLEDFRKHLRHLRKMGSLEELLKMIPGFGRLKGRVPLSLSERELIHMEAIINSMTKAERRRPSIINGSRRRRIARGSGTSVQDVNRLLRQYEMTKKLLRQLQRGGRRGLMGLLPSA